MSEAGAARLEIAVGVIYNTGRDRVLLARRPETAEHGGLWEFPGGKCEPGESIGAALYRELQEELNLQVLESVPLLSVEHDYPGRQVRLNVHEVERWRGKLEGREGQDIEWVPIRELSTREFPAANRAIVAAVTLPPLFVITPDLKEYGDDFFVLTRQLLRAGLRMLQFRSTRARGAAREQAISGLAELCVGSDCQLLLNDSPGMAARYGAAGVHLNSPRLLQLNERPLEPSFIVGASCHNRNELMHAAALGLDYVALGPVRMTTSHPGTVPLGWDKFEGLAGMARLPVYALGGMHPEDMKQARACGARGLAMISGVWGARDPEAAVQGCQRRGVNIC